MTSRLASFTQDNEGPLKGIRVVDLTTFINGPSATGQMCEQGATVVKVETSSGDAMRQSAGGGGTYSPQFELLNRGKMSMTLDLKHRGSKTVFRRLVEWADVLAENFKTGTMDRLGLGYEVVSKWNPKLIYASNSGFGPKGEWAHRPSYDGMAQAFTGALTSNGGGPSHPPRPVGWSFSDIVGGNLFYSAILAALVARGRTGKGQHVLCSQTGATLYFQRAGVSQALDLRGGAQNDSGKHDWENFCFQQTHKASDGRGICVSVTKWDQFLRFLDAVGRPDLATLRNVKKRWPVPPVKSRDTIISEIKSVIAKRPLKYWLDACVQRNVPCSPIASYADIGDPNSSVGKHMRDNNYIIDVDHRDYGALRWVGRPTTYTGTPTKKPPPRGESWHGPYIGEHSRYILMDALGYTESETNELICSGIVPEPTGTRAIHLSRNARKDYGEKMQARRAKVESLRKEAQLQSKL